MDARLDVNVALNRLAYQSSTYTDEFSPFVYPANHANDGDHGTNMNSNTCAHSQSPETNPWWAVDLAVALHVTGVKLTNRDGSGT